MRRIYESRALHRDDEPFSPQTRAEPTVPQVIRSVDSTAVSRRVVPDWLCHRAVSVDVSTPQSTYPARTAVPFTVTMKNTMPFPITLTTSSPIPWTWTVDGVPEAAHVSLHDPPDEPRAFRFGRGERKQFRRQWQQTFRVETDEWEPAEPGSYTIGAELNVDEPASKGLYDETTVRIEPHSD